MSPNSRSISVEHGFKQNPSAKSRADSKNAKFGGYFRMKVPKVRTNQLSEHQTESI